MIRNNQNRRRRGGNNNGPRPQQMSGGNNYGNRLDNRQRGNASQLLEKYRALARDAQQAGDRVTAEYYLQYADHYFRVLGDYREKAPNDGRQRNREFYEDDATGYNANADDADGGDDDDQDGDRSEDRSETAVDTRGDDNRSQWRDDRGNANTGRNRDAPREPRPDNRNDARNNDGRDRQGWSGQGASRNRDDNRGEQRPREDRSRDERPRDDRQRDERPRDERPRDDNRAERPRERRPEYQRPAPVDPVISDEGPIPGLPGPATLRVKRPAVDEQVVRAERPARAPRREAEAPIVNEAMAPAVVADVALVADAEVAAPRRRGRPRKVVDAAPIEG